MLNKVRLMVKRTVDIPLTKDYYFQLGFGMHEFEVVDGIDTKSDWYDLTSDVENFEQGDQFGTYYRVYAVVDDGDISFYAVEDKANDN